MNKKAFVTGGTGFIGTNLIKLLAKENWGITALYRNGSNRSIFEHLPITWVHGSVTNPHSLVNIIPKGTDVVFHLAGDTNLWSNRNKHQCTVNINGTKNMVAAARQSNVSTFIHTSSVAAWGDISGTVTKERTQHGDESWINYEYTKWLGERKALEGTEHGMNVIILNPANVIGPHDKNNWGRLFIALRDNALPVIADGCVSVANVNSITKAHISAVSSGRSGERYILGGAHHRFSNFVNCINTISKADNMPTTIPTWLFRSYARLSCNISSLFNKEPSLTPELAYLMTRKNVEYSSQKAKQELGYTVPRMQKSVQQCYDWLKHENIL